MLTAYSLYPLKPYWFNNSLLSMFKAAIPKILLFMERCPKGKWKRFPSVLSGVARPIQTVPTGLSSDPPVGPAIPVVDMA